MQNTNEVTWLANEGWDTRLHIAANGELVNVFLLVTERYVILVDTLLNATTAQALVDHAQPYLPGRQLLVINSHADWDHAWGNQLFAAPNAPYPAPIIAHVKGAMRHHAPETLARLVKMQHEEPAIFGGVVLTKPTLTFSHDLIIDGGDLTLHLFPTPGHSDDHIAVYIPEISTLLAGDAAELPFPILYNSADVPVLRASLARMAERNARDVFYCHAPPTIGAQLLHDNIAYYDALEAACRAALARGLDTDAIPNADLPAALTCEYASVLPTTGAWADISLDYRTEGHARQLRFMLAWLQQKDFSVEES